MSEEQEQGPEPGFKKYNEKDAYAFDGVGQEGPMQLGHDVLLYSRFCAFEQGVIDRLAMSDKTLVDELEDYEGKPGIIYLGNSEEIREYLHDEIDKMFAVIYGHRGMLRDTKVTSVLQNDISLDEIIYPEGK